MPPSYNYDYQQAMAQQAFIVLEVWPMLTPVQSLIACQQYISWMVSLTSNISVRYEGTLYTIDPAARTVALKSVRCYGTENRSTANFSVPATNHVYEYIVFQAEEIQHLVVFVTAAQAATPAQPPLDPAIQSMGGIVMAPAPEPVRAAQHPQQTTPTFATAGTPRRTLLDVLNSPLYHRIPIGTERGRYAVISKKSKALTSQSARSTAPSTRRLFPNIKVVKWSAVEVSNKMAEMMADLDKVSTDPPRRIPPLTVPVTESEPIDLADLKRAVFADEHQLMSSLSLSYFPLLNFLSVHAFGGRLEFNCDDHRREDFRILNSRPPSAPQVVGLGELKLSDKLNAPAVPDELTVERATATHLADRLRTQMTMFMSETDITVQPGTLSVASLASNRVEKYNVLSVLTQIAGYLYQESNVHANYILLKTDTQSWVMEFDNQETQLRISPEANSSDWPNVPPGCTKLDVLWMWLTWQSAQRPTPSRSPAERYPLVVQQPVDTSTTSAQHQQRQQQSFDPSISSEQRTHSATLGRQVTDQDALVVLKCLHEPDDDPASSDDHDYGEDEEGTPLYNYSYFVELCVWWGVKCVVKRCAQDDCRSISLRRELAAYKQLKPAVQGVYVPEFLHAGHFLSFTERDYYRHEALFIATKFIEGSERLDTIPQPAREPFRALAVTALQKVHDCGILHCDIDERNILVDKQTSRVYIIDFGECAL